MTALLLIGLQVDRLPGGGAEVPGSEALPDLVRGLLPEYSLVVAAHFWLPVEHQIFAANHPWRKPGQPMQVGSTLTELQNYWCIQGSFGAEMMPGIDLQKIKFTAQMGTRPDVLPHNAFFDDEKKVDTGLASFLRENAVDELHLAGLPLATTVRQTAQAAKELGFKTEILTPACRG